MWKTEVMFLVIRWQSVGWERSAWRTSMEGVVEYFWKRVSRDEELLTTRRMCCHFPRRMG